MRSPLARLAGLVAAALLIAPVAVVVPAEAATAGYGTLTVNIVDGAGKPVSGAVYLVDSLGETALFGTPGSGITTFTGEVLAGSYGVVVFGGWAGISCLGLQTCSFIGFSGGGTDPVISIPAVVMADQGTQTLTVNTKNPKVVGNGKVGSPLEVTVPSTLNEFSLLYGGFYGGYSTLPGVTWRRNGKVIPGATKTTYKPTGADYKKSLTALVTYPAIVTYYLTSVVHADITPSPVTTKGIEVTKTKPTLKLIVPGKIRQGERPDALVKLNSQGKPIAGLVQLKIKGKSTVNGLARGGFAEIKLPALKPGKYKVTAAYGGSDVYAPTSVTKTVTVKG